jgi:hypothetical protein
LQVADCRLIEGLKIGDWRLGETPIARHFTNRQSALCQSVYQSAIRNPQSAIRNLQSAICNPQSAIRNLQSAMTLPPPASQNRLPGRDLFVMPPDCATDGSSPTGARTDAPRS